VKWLPGKTPDEPVEVAQLAQLLMKISGSAGGNGRMLLEVLISIADRYSTGGFTGAAELRWLRDSADQKTAEAAASLIVERARADHEFSAAFGDWRGRDRVQELLGSLAAESRHKPSKKGWLRKLADHKVLASAGGIAGATVITLVVTALVDTLQGDVGNLHSGHPVEWAIGWQSTNGLNYALADSLALSGPQLAQVNSLNGDLSASQAWFARHGAVPLGDLYIDLPVRGNRSSAVQIVNIRPIAQNCHAALTGTVFSLPAQGGYTNTQLLYNLADPLVPAGYTVDDGGQINDEPNYFLHHTVSLEKGEPFTFLIHAHMYAAEYCQFTFDMSVDDGGQIVHQRIDNNGSPFAITGTCAAPSRAPFSCYKEGYDFNFLTGAWQRANPATYSP
jgi:hypothetical protein